MAGSADTIFALSSGGLPSGVAVLRISGTLVKSLLQELCGVVPGTRYASLRSIRDRQGELIDRGLVLFFEGPHSFTGEDCAELQVHGSRAVVNRLLRFLGEQSQVRMAEAGEFSRRAFENGKLDLVEIEGLSELISAETEVQRKQALRFSEGTASEQYKNWMERLSFARAMIEAELDFSDEGDIPGSISDSVWEDLRKLRQEIESALSGVKANEIIREGFRVVITGEPNVGKSSLLNYLAGRDVAIVTDVAGTTRDVLSVDLDLDGLKVSVIDTAGIRETSDIVELAGIEKARKELEKADLRLRLCSFDSVRNRKDTELEKSLWVVTKADLADTNLVDVDPALHFVSSKTGSGIDSLLKRIRAIAEKSVGGAESSVVLNERQRACLAEAFKYLGFALDQVEQPIEVRAENLRWAGNELGRIVGLVTPDELLGIIFSRFCVGK